MYKYLRAILILSLFSWNTIVSQIVSPYFPIPFQNNSINKDECQMTYFDLSFENNKIQKFLHRKLAMTPDDTKYDLKEDEGTITKSYIEKIAVNREPRKLIFSFKVFPIKDDLVIEQLKISGDNEKVLSFYIRYWSTSLNFEDVKKNEVVSNKFFQDHISYSYNNNNPTILVKNNTIKNRKEFISDYSKKREVYDLKQKGIAEKKQERLKQKKITDEEFYKKQDLRRNTKYEKYYYTIVKKRNKVNFELKDRKHKTDTLSSNVDFKKELNSFISGKKNGIYRIRATYKLVYGKFEKLDLYINSYEKPKSLLQMISY